MSLSTLVRPHGLTVERDSSALGYRRPLRSSLESRRNEPHSKLEGCRLPPVANWPSTMTRLQTLLLTESVTRASIWRCPTPPRPDGPTLTDTPRLSPTQASAS